MTTTKEAITHLLTLKEPRHIYKEFVISKFGEPMLDKIMEETGFLHKDARFPWRLYCVYNGITENPRCNHCGKEVDFVYHSFQDPVDQRFYSKFCNQSCQRLYRYQFVTEVEPLIIPFATKEEIDNRLANCSTTSQFSGLIVNRWLCASINNYLLKNGINVTNFNTNNDGNGKGGGPIEAMYFIKNNRDKFPHCLHCGKRVNYDDNGKYHLHCSNVCNTRSSSSSEKREKTVESKYGVKNTFQLPYVHQRSVESHMKNHGGHKCYFNTPEFLANANTYWEESARIGRLLEHTSKELDKTYKEACELPHVEPLFTREEFLGKNTRINSWDYIKYKWRCKKCGEEFMANMHRCYCKTCSGNSRAESEIAGLISSWGFDVIRNSRSVISNDDGSKLELDIYIPSMNIAIEYDGMFYHSEVSLGEKASSYHLNKTKMCEKLGIRLIHVWESDWYSSKISVINMLKKVLLKEKYIININKCEVKEIKFPLALQFISKYSLEPVTISSHNFGLYYKNRLISVMTFKKSRNEIDIYEIANHCKMGSFKMDGYFELMLSNFIKINNPDAIIFRMNKAYMDKSEYKQFIVCGDTKPDYTYLKSPYLHRLIRPSLDQLKEMFDDYNPSLTEVENMRNHKYTRIFDCGKTIMKWVNPSIVQNQST